MHPLAHRVAQGPVHDLVTFYQRTALELRADDQRFEMIPASCEVSYLDVSARKRLFDRKLQLCRLHEKRILTCSKRPNLYISPGISSSSGSGASRKQLSLEQVCGGACQFSGGSGTLDAREQAAVASDEQRRRDRV